MSVCRVQLVECVEIVKELTTAMIFVIEEAAKEEEEVVGEKRMEIGGR